MWFNFVQAWARVMVAHLVQSEFPEYNYRAWLEEGKRIRSSYNSTDFSVLSVTQKSGINDHES